MPEKKGKHLDIDDRSYIEEALRRQDSFRDIARHLDVSPTTVSHEVRTNRHFEKNRRILSLSSRCRACRGCAVSDLCGPACPHPGRRCASCPKVACITLCPGFQPHTCQKLEKAPFVCVGCTVRGCTLDHAVYRASAAQAASDRRARESRCGIDIGQADLEHMVLTVRRLLAQGQSIQNIWFTHGDEFPVSERTFYNYMHRGVMGMTLMELRNSVSRRPRAKRTEKAGRKMDLSGRTYLDWCALSEQERISTVEMDCIEGRSRDHQVLLSLHFKRFEFQLYVLLAEQTQACVIGALDAIETYCEGRFGDVFGIVLTDRGHEFLDFEGIEKGGRCRVFYCDPQKPGQKGSCERNHVELRKVLPKKVSDFDALTTWDVAEINSHVNSYKRGSLGGIAPIALASQVLPENLLGSLGVRMVPPDEVIMHPKLIERG